MTPRPVVSPDAPVVVAVAGQTPPPHHGQAIMIEQLLAGDYAPLRLVHVPMRFSARIEDVGRPGLGKVAELVRVVARLWRARFRDGARVLYYPPAGPSLVPVLRDVVVLLAARGLFRATVFHFHAGGLGAYLAGRAWPLRALGRLAYGRPDLAIRPSPLAPDDGAALGARAERVVPYGIEDAAGPADLAGRPARGAVRLLYVGAVRESKGVEVLLEAAARLVARGHDVEVALVGRPVSEAYAAHLATRILALGLAGRAALDGEKTGAAKWAAYARADVFCFPTFYEAETFGVVVAEAMSFGLPVVAARWRGVPSVVDEACARLVPPRDAGALADALEALVTDAGLRARMGAAARRRFERELTVEGYHRRLGEAFAVVAGVAEERDARA